MILCAKPVAVVILNYNGLAFLQSFLPIVIRHSSEIAEVIVADNASNDSSVQYLEAHYPDVSLVKMHKNSGFAEGYNVALKQIEAKYFVLLNSDVEVTPNWLWPLYNFLENNNNVAGVQPKILAHAARSSFEHAGASGGMIDTLGYPFCRGRIFDTVEQDDRQYDDEISIAWASGAAMAIRSAVYKDFEGFDGDFFAHMEEIDFCWRVKNAGYDWKVVPSSVVYHVGGGTLDYGSPQKTYLNFRNSLWCLVKNDRSGMLAFKVIARLLLDGVAGLQFLLKDKSLHTKAIIRAHWTFFGKLRAALIKRKHMKMLTTELSIGTVNKNGLFPRSIVVEYYLLKRKIYKLLTF